MSNGAYSIVGSEFLVNTTTTGLQTDVAITSLASGGFVMTWTDNSATGVDTSGSGIKAQIYDANGNPAGSEFLVNTQTLNAQEASSVTSLANGGFVVTWTDNSATGPDPDRAGIKAQIFDASGNKLGSEFLVNTTTKLSQTTPVITSLANGGFVVSWTDASATGPDPKGTGVKAQIYDASGQKVGTEIQVNTTILGSQLYSSTTGLANGGFVVTWVDNSGLGGDPTAPSVKGQIFSATGAKVGTEFLVNTNVAASQDQAVVSALSNGGFVVVWRDTSGVGDTSAAGVKAQIYDATGARVGGEFQVNTTELNTQDQPTVTAIPGGGFAVSWEDNSILASDSSGLGIKTQVFDNQGNKLGNEFQTNSVTTGNQTMPSITALSSGALVVAWADASGLAPDSSGGIKAQMFSPSSGAISNLLISNTQLSEAAVENTIVASLTANGALNASYSYQLIDDSTGGAFSIVDNKLEVKNSLLLDYETQPSATLTIRASDTFGNSFDKVFNMTLQDAVIENRYAADGETLANTTIANNQTLSAMTAISGNRYVITWTDSSGVTDTSSNGIKAQVVDANGNKVGAEFQVNTQTLNSQDNPAIAALGSGGFVVTWTDSSATGGDTSSSGIKAQMYDASGNAVGSEFLVNTTTTNAQKNAAVSSLSNGGFVVTWNDASLLGGDSSVSSVKAQIFDAAGNKVGSEFLVNTNTNNRQDTPVITGLTNGGFVVSWDDSSGVGDTSKDGIKAQIFDASGNKIGSEFLVNTRTASNQQAETITALDNGGFVVAWADASGQGGDTDNFGIKMQIYDASGHAVGGETLVNTTTAGAQLAPGVTALSTGGFTVSWADYSGAGPETGTSGIKAQTFADDGTRVGGEFIVNNEVRGTQGDPTIAAAANGSFAVGWTDYSGQGGDDSGSSVKMRIFNPLATQGPPPSLIAGSDTLSGTEDTVSTFQASTLLANDVDAQGLPLTVTGVTAVSGGSVSLDAHGNITFTPLANFNGAALFNYTVVDTGGLSATGRVTVNVAAVNDPPTANNDQVTVSEDGGTIPGSTLLANDVDVDVGDKLSIQSIPATSSSGATLTLSNGIITYAPGQTFQYLHAGETATDSFSYTMTDLAGATSTATVNLTIAGANDAPSNTVLSNARVDENAANGTVVGTLSATDPDHDEVLQYSLTNNAGGRFAVDPNTGVVTVANGALLDYETSPTQTIVTRVTDSTGLFVDTSFTISLNNLPEPKSWTGDNGVNVFTAPSNDLWTINGLGGNDILTGNASSDTINGGSGNDIIDGAGGADTMYGGMGNDTFYVDNPGDQVIENAGEGTDLVNTSIDYTMTANVENLTQLGTADLSATGNALANTITGNSGNNSFHGGAGGDLIQGNDGNDIIYGEDQSDFLQGGNGNDTLIGGAGNDQLTGGAGADSFVFDSLVSGEFDTVKDFSATEGDVFVISKAVFAAFANTPLGTLPTSAFVNGLAATTADQHIIYNKSQGNIYYDPDGNGSQAMVQIAFVSTKPLSLSASNFQIGS
jgi:Ca2+-binding RTX toxin-like protein